MSEPKHTAGEWRVGYDPSIIECNLGYSFAGRGESREQIEANVEYIVRACNAFPDQDRMLRRVRDTLAALGIKPDTDIMQDLAAAIAKAQPEGGK